MVSCSAEDVEVQPTPPELLEKIEAMIIFVEADCHFWESLKTVVVTCAFYRNSDILRGKTSLIRYHFQKGLQSIECVSKQCMLKILNNK